MTCTIAGRIKCRYYDFCRLAIKDKEPEKCVVRFDYEFQARRNKIFGLDFVEINKKQHGGENEQ